MWKNGRIGNFSFNVKVYSEGSEFGIEGGKISKLEIMENGRRVVNYDRGWDLKPNSKTQAVYQEIIEKFN